jgi:hypothetical protein
MTEQDITKMRPEELAKRLHEYVTGYDDRSMPALILPVVDEMERRLKEVDDCICWGVGCVHQAKELDKSYSRYTAAERAQAVLDNPNNYNHAPNLRAAIKELIDIMQEHKPPYNEEARMEQVKKAAADVAASMRATAVAYQDEWPPGALEVLLHAAKEVEQIPDATAGSMTEAGI